MSSTRDGKPFDDLGTRRRALDVSHLSGPVQVQHLLTERALKRMQGGVAGQTASMGDLQAEFERIKVRVWVAAVP